MKKSKPVALLVLILITSIIRAQTPTLWGTTYGGGTGGTVYHGGQGTIFSFNLNTNTETVQHNFTDSDGGPPGALILAGNGLLYGINSESEDGLDTGSIFSFNMSTGIATKIHGFGNPNTGMSCDGIFPLGALLKASNGLLYGTTTGGGCLGGGTIFKLDITTGIETIVHNFNFDLSEYGIPSETTLLEASDGLLYGTTERGGLNYSGEIFSFNTLTDSVLAVADSVPLIGYFGHFSTAGLIQANNLLYGTTLGDPNTFGMIYSYNMSTHLFSDVHNFGAGYDGESSRSSLFKASDNLLYGMTESGGLYNNGVIYSYNTNTGIETVLYSFGNDTDGQVPIASFIQASNGLLYATTGYGGAYGYGTIISYNIVTQKESVVFSFDSIDGARPWGSLLEIIDTPSGIRSVSPDIQLQIYPNPATDQLFIKTEGIQPQAVSIYDVAGRLISTQPFSNQISIGLLSNGVYFVEVQSAGEEVRKRFIKMQ